MTLDLTTQNWMWKDIAWELNKAVVVTCERTNRYINCRSELMGEFPGSENLPAELFQASRDDYINHFYEFIKIIWTKTKLTTDWEGDLVCFIKEDPICCDNYRGITVLNAAYKILADILCNYLRPLAEKIAENAPMQISQLAT